jgi:hypothetical protein
MNKRTLLTYIPIVSWKGKTISQITSILKKNNNTTNKNIYSPNPLKIYRRELVTNISNTTCNSRTSVKIDEIDRPSGSIVNTKNTKPGSGLVNTLDINLTNNSSDIPGNCSSCQNVKVTTGSSGANAVHGFSPAQNALKRVRSSGMIKRQFDLTTNKPTYYVDNRQYLESRNLTQDQNKFNFLIKGDATTTPGTRSALSNTYAANGSFVTNKSCGLSGHAAQVYYKPNNPQFGQQGAVTSSSHITRVKYDSVTNSSVLYSRTVGSALANALAYGVPEPGYTSKDIIGYPNINTPVIDKYTGKLKKACYWIPRKK